MSKNKPQTANWKARRRFHAIKLKGKGWKQREIATALDVSEGAVSRWLKSVEEKGNFNEKDFLLSYLDQVGSKKREFRQPGTSVYLYLYDLIDKVSRGRTIGEWQSENSN